MIGVTNLITKIFKICSVKIIKKMLLINFSLRTFKVIPS